jgi:hypothetical protein
MEKKYGKEKETEKEKKKGKERLCVETDQPMPEPVSGWIRVI